MSDRARMVKQVDTRDLKSLGFAAVPVRSRLRVPSHRHRLSNGVVMIIFDLSCVNGHRFEGWFQSQQDFERQLGDELIACPRCTSPDIGRVPSAVHIARTPPALAASVSKTTAIDTPTSSLAAYHQLTTLLLSGCEDVGPRFAEEARKIHYADAPPRSIRGQASAEEYEALRDEGIEVFCLPLLKAGDLH